MMPVEILFGTMMDKVTLINLMLKRKSSVILYTVLFIFFIGCGGNDEQRVIVSYEDTVQTTVLPKSVVYQITVYALISTNVVLCSLSAAYFNEANISSLVNLE